LELRTYLAKVRLSLVHLRMQHFDQPSPRAAPPQTGNVSQNVIRTISSSAQAEVVLPSAIQMHGRIEDLVDLAPDQIG
jgi:hypothetical protein